MWNRWSNFSKNCWSTAMHVKIIKMYEHLHMEMQVQRPTMSHLESRYPNSQIFLDQFSPFSRTGKSQQKPRSSRSWLLWCWSHGCYHGCLWRHLEVCAPYVLWCSGGGKRLQWSHCPIFFRTQTTALWLSSWRNVAKTIPYGLDMSRPRC